MATCRPLYLGLRPVVVTMPYWLYSSEIGAAFDALKRAAGPELVVVRDPSVLVGVLRTEALDDPVIAEAHASLIDELTVWRLSTDDGRRHPRLGAGDVGNAACAARHLARRRQAA